MRRRQPGSRTRNRAALAQAPPGEFTGAGVAGAASVCAVTVPTLAESHCEPVALAPRRVDDG